jgi:hypothetical protein
MNHVKPVPKAGCPKLFPVHSRAQKGEDAGILGGTNSLKALLPENAVAWDFPPKLFQSLLRLASDYTSVRCLSQPPMHLSEVFHRQILSQKPCC